MVQSLKIFFSICLLSATLGVLPVPAAERAETALEVNPLQDDRRSPPAPEPRPSAPLDAATSGQGGDVPFDGSSVEGRGSAPPVGTAIQEGREKSGTVVAYLIELARRQNRPCPSGAASPAPPSPLTFSEPLCAVAREAAAGGEVGAILAAKGLSAGRWHSFSAAEEAPQDAVNRLRAEYCEALMADLTHIGAVRESGRWWVVMASLGRGVSSAAPVRNGQTVPPGQGKEAEALLALLNDARIKGTACRGKILPPAGALKINARLDRAARRHAEDMAVSKYFGMVSPAGVDLEKRVLEERYPWKAVTELIAKGPPPASAVLDLWLSNPAQCEQIMDPTLADAGIGYNNEYWALIMGREASGDTLPPGDAPPGYAGNGTLRPASRGAPSPSAVPERLGPEPQKRR